MSKLKRKCRQNENEN